MLYESLIQKFLDKNFTIVNYGYSIYCFDIEKQKELCESEIVKILTIIFAESTNDVSRLLYDWVKIKKNNHFDILSDFLEKCSIIDNKLGWIVVKDGEEITTKKLINIFEKQYQRKEVIYFYDEWYNHKICEISEKIMNEY
jgi:hypothetical protein